MYDLNRLNDFLFGRTKMELKYAIGDQCMAFIIRPARYRLTNQGPPDLLFSNALVFKEFVSVQLTTVK